MWNACLIQQWLWITLTTVGSCLGTQLRMQCPCSSRYFVLAIVHILSACCFDPAVAIVHWRLMLLRPASLPSLNSIVPTPQAFCVMPSQQKSWHRTLLLPEGGMWERQFTTFAQDGDLAHTAWLFPVDSQAETNVLQVHMHPLSVFAIEFYLPEQQRNAAFRILYYGFHTSICMSS